MLNLINYWHSIIDMPKHDLAWHKQDMADEMQEYEEAKGLIEKWSELSDVAYTYTRAHWSGHMEMKYPRNRISLYVGFIYMLPKYSLRWRFFRKLGRKFDKSLKITEVRNPQKIEKLEHIAKKYGLDPEKFTSEARKLIKRRLFLK